MITLPEVPALLLEGSPVYVDRCGTLQRATYLGQDGEHRFCAAKDRGMFILGEEPLRLDLEDKTGRAHAAWWLAGQPAQYGTSWRGLTKRQVSRHIVGEFPTLDPADPRLLPDGSRCVDAEALRLVCLHVAGVKS